MARPVPANLALLRAAFDPKRVRDILPGDIVTIDGIDLVCEYGEGSTADRFYIVKAPELVERYLELCEVHQGARIVELGIAEGGSTALLAIAARPSALVAVDLEECRVDALDEMVAARGLDDVVHTIYGIDQGDREALASAVDRSIGDEPIDLVIDDCSHVIGPTRRSFETLFPRLRPGGLYVIEDWNNDHVMRDAVAASLRQQLEQGNEEVRSQLREGLRAPAPTERRVPLSSLAIEAILARASSGDAVAEVIVDEWWVSIRRGPGELDPATFRLDQTYTDHFGLKGW